MLESKDLQITTYPKPPTTGMLTGTLGPGVKIVHIPTGIFVVCDSERHQYLNRKLALQQLIAKLAEHR